MTATTIQRHCPKCRTPRLVEKRLSDRVTLIDVCPVCRGGWFDARELAAVLSVAIDDFRPSADAERTARICPRCGIPLARIHYPETRVEVDACVDCRGLWLDRGEFREIHRVRARLVKRQPAEAESEPPRNFREAVLRFVDRMLVRLHDH